MEKQEPPPGRPINDRPDRWAHFTNKRSLALPSVGHPEAGGSKSGIQFVD
jgi:hypothetical protein